MNLQENCRCSRCACSERLIGFFVLLLAAALGLIFGAVYAEAIFRALAAVIVFAVVMAVSVIALLIFAGCRGCWNRRDD